MKSLYQSVVAVAAAAICASGCFKAETAARSREEAKSVKIETVRQEAARRTVEVVGTLAAQEEVTISSEAEGTVSAIRADLGDRVLAGSVLIELDREKAKYKLDQAKAASAQSLAKYGATASGELPPIEQTPDVEKAAAELAQAQQAFDRTKELSSRGIWTTQQLDDANATLTTKKASYASSLQSARNLRADIDAADASMRLAERELRDTSIRAPFDGYVQKRIVSPGEFVKTQMPVMSVVRVDPLKVTAEIPERMAPWIKVGQPVQLSVDAFPETFTGTVARISPAVNPQSRAFPFEALVPNADGRLKPGTFTRVRIETALIEPVLTLPYAAMQYRYGVNRVFVVAGDHLAARELKVGDRVGDRIQIVDGVKSGEQVAVTDVEKLTDGLKIKIATK